MSHDVVSPARDPESLRILLTPVLDALAALDPARQRSDDAVSALERALNTQFPVDGPLVSALKTSLLDGVDAGWLCDRGEPHARFCRLAKPTEDTHGFSMDVVSLAGEAVEHTHPNGEVTIGFEARDSDASSAPTFDGRPPGWVFLGPGSRHRPRVDGGRMVLLYFLQDGAVEWHFDGA